MKKLALLGAMALTAMSTFAMAEEQTMRIGIEAAVRQGWDRWLLGERGREAKADFVGMDRFGASAPAEELFEKFDITPQNVADKAKALL